MKDLIKMAVKLLEKCNVCSVASVSEAGYPRICILTRLKAEGIKSLWFSTGASGTKVRHFKSNSKAGVTFYAEGDSVTLMGEVKIMDDENEKKEFWKEWSNFLSNHFYGLEDPEYLVIRFVANEATIYINGEFDTVKL